MAIIGTITPTLKSNLGKKALDLVYRNNAILLNDGMEIIFGVSNKTFGNSTLGAIAGSIASSVPLPLLGFVYEHPQTMELLKYEYSTYPYINHSMVMNSYIKQKTTFSINAYRAITLENGVIANIGLNELIYAGLEKYADSCGRFTLMTMWGMYSNLLLKELKSIQPEGNQTGGVGFNFTFERMSYKAEDSISGKIVNSLASLGGGYL